MRLLLELSYARCRCRTCRVDRLEWLWYMTHVAPGAFVISFAPLPPVCRHPEPVQACRVCGCWQYDACLDENGEPCHWAEADLCSACAPADRAGVATPHPYLVVH